MWLWAGKQDLFFSAGSFVRGDGLGAGKDDLKSVAAMPTAASVLRVKNIVTVFLHSMQLPSVTPVSYTHLRAHETSCHLVCRLLLEKKFF